MRVASLIFVGALSIVTARVEAQTAPPAATAPSGVPNAEAVTLGAIASALREGSWTYVGRATINGQDRDFGQRTITLTRGADAEWIIVDAQQSPEATATDSIVFAPTARTELRRVLRTKSALGDVTLTMRFAGDSATGEMTVGGEKRPVAIGGTRDALSSDAILTLALPKLGLTSGWSGRVAFLNPIGGGVVPVMLHVTGEEQVTVPAGTFDCWVVRAEAGEAGETTYYVAKNGPVARITVTLPQMAGASVELSLTK